MPHISFHFYCISMHIHLCAHSDISLPKVGAVYYIKALQIILKDAGNNQQQ